MKGINIDEAVVREALGAEFDAEYGETGATFTRDEYIETNLKDIVERVAMM